MTDDIPRTKQPFSTWDKDVNPRWWFFEVYGEIPFHIDDRREYNAAGFIKHLTDNGARILERTSRIEGGEATGFDRHIFYNSDSGNSVTYLYKGYIISLEIKETACTFDLHHSPRQKPSLDEFAPFLRPLEKGSVSILLKSEHGGLYLKRADFTPPQLPNLDLNYGTGFTKVHIQIMEKLNRRRAGLMLLHGHTGSGKSFYIKYLTSLIDRDFIFIPISMVGLLSTPEFLRILMDNAEAVIILEDAEQALQSRDEDVYNSSTVSTLLNLSDGIMGTLLNITIIATFNADKATVDKALLRRGRLLQDHEFTKLSVEDGRRLASHLKRDLQISEPISLADIYNATEDTGYKEVVKRAVGFNFADRYSSPPTPSTG